MQEAVRFRTNGRIAIATIDNPPVNALSRGVREGLVAAVEALESRGDLDALVIAASGSAFSAGADVTEFGSPPGEPHMATLAARIEGAAKPIVAAIQGRALGAGLEIALCCHYRVVAPDARIGLPEVKLGIIPGCGGTQRLPRLVGLETALVMIAEGEDLGARNAAEQGAIDAVIDEDLITGAIAFVQSRLADGAALPRVRDLSAPADDPELFDAVRTRLAKRKRGYQAPLEALEAVKLAVTTPFEVALTAEHAKCMELMDSPQARALRHVFAAERVVGKIAGLPAATVERPVERVAIVGLGAMGTGLATLFASAGLPVLCLGRTPERGQAAIGRIAKSLAGLVKRGTIDQIEADRRLARVTPVEDYPALADADLVVEAVSEDMADKRAVFTALGGSTRPGTILASNTSYLDIDGLAEASGRPADVCGMHFFNPPTTMRLLENVRASRTAPDVIATIMSIGRRIGKLAILSGLSNGFIVNRMLSKRSREASFLLEEGATPAQVDKVLLGFGFPMGPYALGDLAGIDVQYAARQARLDRLTPRERRADFVDQLHALGRLGQKTGAGWYLYDENRKPSDDPAISALLAAHARRHGIAPRQVEDREILERCLYAMVNEGAKIIEEGVVPRPHEIDVAMINGVGFPAYTGGPMWWADTIGLASVRDSMLRYRDIAGAEYWTPASLLDRLAAEGKGFYELSAEASR